MDNETENVTGNLGKGELPNEMELSATNPPEQNKLVPKVFGDHVYIEWKGVKPFAYESDRGLWVHVCPKSLMRVPIADLGILKPKIKRGMIIVMTDEEGEEIIRSRRITKEEKLKLYNVKTKGSVEDIAESLPQEVLEKLEKAGLDEEVDAGLVDKFISFMKKDKSKKSKSKSKSKKGTGKKTSKGE